jgi:hypothetical protein
MLARLAAILAISLLVLGAIWYGFSAETRQRLFGDLFDRRSGPMAFRFLLQPLMAALAALYDGIGDARAGRSPFLWTVLTKPHERAGRLREALIATARILLLGLGMDTIYQLRVFSTFYPGEAAIIAIALAFVPYLLLRGPAARLARWWQTRFSSVSTERRP